MKRVSRCFLITILTISFMILSSSSCLAQTDLDGSLDALAARIVDVMDENTAPKAATEKTRLAVLDFPDLEGNVTSLGRFVAEELTTRLFLTKRFEVIERQLLDKVLGELKLSASGLVNSSSAQELGNILGVSAIVSGTLSELSSTVRVNARVIATQTGMIVAAASVELPKDAGVEQLLGKVLAPTVGFIPDPAGTDLPVLPVETTPDYPAQVGGGSPTGTSRLPEEQKYKDRIEQALNSGDYRKAFSLCQEALEVFPGSAFAHAALGFTYLQLQPPNKAQARMALEKAVAITDYPWGDGFSHYLLGRLYGEMGRRTEARFALEKAVQRYQIVGGVQSTGAWYDQAVQLCVDLYQAEIRTCWEQEDYLQALFLSEQAINLFNPAFAYAAQGYSLLKLDPERAPEAVTSLQTALQLANEPSGDGWTYYLLGWAYLECGEDEKALEALERAVTVSRRFLLLNPPIWYDDCQRLLTEIYDDKIGVLLAAGDYQAAIAFLEEALDFAPEYTNGLIALGFAYLKTEAPGRALEVLEKAHSLEEKPAEPGWGYYLLGWAYRENERFGSAVDSLGKALREVETLGVDDGTVEWVASCRKLLVESYEELFSLYRFRGGNTSYYLTMAEESIGLLPDFATGYALKGYCIIKLSPQRNTEAFELLKQATDLKEDPTGDGWLDYVFGLAYQQRGDEKTARTYLEKALRRCAEVHPHHTQLYWYRQCETLLNRLLKQKRMMMGLSVNVDSWAEDPYLMVKIGSEKGRPGNSFTGLKIRLGASEEVWRAELGGELAWEGKIFPPSELVGWYTTLGGGFYGFYSFPEHDTYLDCGFYFTFGTGLRIYLGKTNHICLDMSSEYRYYPHGASALAFGCNIGLPSH